MNVKLFAAVAAIVLPFGAATAQDATTEEQARPAQAQAEPVADARENATAQAEPSPVVAATPADIRAGAQVIHTSGEAVGTVESVDEDGAVVSTGSRRAKLPFASFGKNNRGLVIALTKAQLEAAASEASGS